MDIRPAVLPARRRWASFAAALTGAALAVGFLVTGFASLGQSMGRDAPPADIEVQAAPVMPPSIVVVQQPPAPPPPAPEQPAPPPPAPQPPTHTTCAADISTVGVPLKLVRDTSVGSDSDPTTPWKFETLEPGPTDLRAAASSDGCTIAEWTATNDLAVSWDGGQTFHSYSLDEPIVSVAVTARRVVLLNAPGNTPKATGSLGFLTPTDAVPTYHPLPEIPELSGVLALFVGGTHVALSNDKTIAVTDDGEAYRYLGLPSLPASFTLASVVRITADGDVVTSVIENPPAEAGDMGPPLFVPHVWTTNVRAGRWHETHATAPGWTYTWELDEFWGCGGNEKLVAHHDGATAVLAGKVRRDVYPAHLAFDGTVGYVTHGSAFYKLTGATETAIDAPVDQLDDFLTVDKYGSLLALSNHRLVRWSPTGGWRLLR